MINFFVKFKKNAIINYGGRENEISEKNLIFCDCADEVRAELADDLSKFSILNLDHHISNTNFGDINTVWTA